MFIQRFVGDWARISDFAAGDSRGVTRTMDHAYGGSGRLAPVEPSMTTQRFGHDDGKTTNIQQHPYPFDHQKWRGTSRNVTYIFQRSPPEYGRDHIITRCDTKVLVGLVIE